MPLGFRMSRFPVEFVRAEVPPELARFAHIETPSVVFGCPCSEYAFCGLICAHHRLSNGGRQLTTSMHSAEHSSVSVLCLKLRRWIELRNSSSGRASNSHKECQDRKGCAPNVSVRNSPFQRSISPWKRHPVVITVGRISRPPKKTWSER